MRNLKTKRNNQTKLDMMKNKERVLMPRPTVYLSGIDKSKSRTQRRRIEKTALRNFA